MTDKQVLAMFDEQLCESQARAFLYYKKKQMRTKIDNRQKFRLNRLMQDRSAAVYTAASGTPDEPAPSSEYNPIFVLDNTDKDEEIDSQLAASSSSKYPTPKRQKTNKASLQTQTPHCRKVSPPARPRPTPVEPRSNLQRLLAKLLSESGPVPLGTPTCDCGCCQFSTGPIMTQRFSLAQRLLAIERQLFGHKPAVRSTNMY